MSPDPDPAPDDLPESPPTETPEWLHMLRGLALAGSEYPFASVDSTDIARNHNRPQNTAARMAERWDALQCSPRWTPRGSQLELEAA